MGKQKSLVVSEPEAVIRSPTPIRAGFAYRNAMFLGNRRTTRPIRAYRAPIRKQVVSGHGIRNQIMIEPIALIRDGQ
jgi:hypothetical protein